MKRLSFSLIFIILTTGLLSQEKVKTITLSGYITTMQSVMFDSLSGPFLNENLLHNRLNFKGYLNENISFAADLRNRLFTGDLVRLGKYYSGLIGKDQGMIDMSWNVIERQSFLFNTTIDRLWLDLHYNRFQVTVGRQRINWGQTLSGIRMTYSMHILFLTLIISKDQEAMLSGCNISLRHPLLQKLLLRLMMKTTSQQQHCTGSTDGDTISSFLEDL